MKVGDLVRIGRSDMLLGIVSRLDGREDYVKIILGCTLEWIHKCTIEVINESR